jgi:Skp family chaperone for outer membrane proteins
MMKKAWITGLLTGLVACVAVFAFGSRLDAQSGAAPTGRIACVDVMKIMNEYQRAKDLREELAQLQQSLENEDKERRGKIDSLRAQVDAMDPQDPMIAGRMRELLELQVSYRTWAELKQLDVAREYGLWSIRIYNELLTAVQETAERDAYDMVFYRGKFEAVSMEPDVIRDQIARNQVLYASDAVDITMTILDKLNNAYRSKPKEQMIQMP